MRDAILLPFLEIAQQENSIVTAPKRVPHLRKPDEMSLEAWQVALRRQFAREQKFRVKNIGAQPIFTEFHVTNPQSGKTYRVAIRGERLGDNYCSCPDFATNTLAARAYKIWEDTARARTSRPIRWVPASTWSSPWRDSGVSAAPGRR
jgi:hypothetical protein